MLAFLNGSKLDLTSIKEVDENFDLNSNFVGWRVANGQNPKHAPKDVSSYALYGQYKFNDSTALEICIALYVGNYVQGKLFGAIYLRSYGASVWSDWKQIGN